MAEVVFYEKPGCINNTRQKKLLLEAGHRVDARNLLEQEWTEAQLLRFFSYLPVAQWFNHNAPQVKTGHINPKLFDQSTALELMMRDPILIRRPLMQCGNQYMVGFDYSRVDDWIGLSEGQPDLDLELCTQPEACAVKES